MRLRAVWGWPLNGAELFQTGSRQMRTWPLNDQVEALGRAGVALVVNCASDADWGLAFYVSAYHHAPFGDNSHFRERLPIIEDAVRDAADTLRNGNNVLVHCFYGANRSGLVNALVIREIERCTGAEALARLRQRRRGACGSNDHFVAYLEGLDRP